MRLDTTLLEQGSPEWSAARCSKATASRMADVMAKGKGITREKYQKQLILERLTGIPADSYISPAMQWGIDTEPQARAAYEWFLDTEITTIGFVEHPSIVDSGASPDGLVGDEGMVQFKCPDSSTHLDFLLGATIPGKYIFQMQWEMACAVRKWCDFCSFDPRMPDNMQLFRKRIERDNELIADLEREVRIFLAGVTKKVAELRKLYGGAE